MNEQQALIPLSIGEYLKQERENLGLSLEDTAAALRLPADVVDAIENDALDRYAPVYRKGYIMAYARHLDLDGPRIAEMLSRIDKRAPELHSLFPRAARQNPVDRWLRATSYVLASLLIGTLAWQVTHEAMRLSQQSNSTAAAEQLLPEAGEQTSPVEPREPVRPATHVNASIAALERLPDREERSGNAGAQAWSALQPAQQPEGRDAGLPADEHLINVSTSGDSWVEISDARGRQLELDLLRGGTSREYRGVAPFRILFGRASAVDLYLDGEQVDTGPFTSGDVTQMTLEAVAGSAAPADADRG